MVCATAVSGGHSSTSSSIVAIQHTPFLVRLSLVERNVCVTRDIEQLRSGSQVRLVRALMSTDLLVDPALLQPPLVRELLVEMLVNDTFELVDIDKVEERSPIQTGNQ